MNEKINEISSFLSSYHVEDSSNPGSINVSELENNRKKKSNEKDDQLKLKTIYESQYESINSKITELDDKLKDAENQNNRNNLLKHQAQILGGVLNNVNLIKDKIMLSMKNEIKEKTWDIFDNVVWKERSFKSINIDDNYNLSVMDYYGLERTENLSATEKMALAYAFTFAIHSASGKNCPMIIDSPLGRTSDINKTNLVRRFVDISKEKQIVLLLTKDECSSDVQEILQDNNIEIRMLKLNEDESEIVDGGKYNG